MALEREVKLTGPLPDLTGKATLGGHGLQHVGLEAQRNTYFDTRAGSLRSLGYSFRLRQLEQGAIFTLKGPSQTRAHGLTEREELESDIVHAQGLEELRDAAILERLTALTPLEAMQPILTLETDRQVYAVAGVGALLLDSVRILGGDGRIVERFTEVELEVGAEVTDATLKNVLLELHSLAPLMPSSMGKFSRAMLALGLNA